MWRRYEQTGPGARAGVGLVLVALLAAACGGGDDPVETIEEPTPDPAPVSAVDVVPGMPPVLDADNIYSEIRPGNLMPEVANDPPRVYVPNHASDNVTVIDQVTREVISTIPSGGSRPQHVVPAWDLETLWIANNSELDHAAGTLRGIDATTATLAEPVSVPDPYNVYFSPDGQYGIVVAEGLQRLDFYDNQFTSLLFTIATPTCPGINHADFSADGSYVLFTCEFAGSMLKISAPNGDWASAELSQPLVLSGGGQPQDVRTSPDGRVFYVAEMNQGRVYLIDGDSFTEMGYLDADDGVGVGTHGLYPSWDHKLYVVNRGATTLSTAAPNGPGSVSIFDIRDSAAPELMAKVDVPGGGSPDMGNFSTDGSELWLGGRYDNVVYVLDLENLEWGEPIPVGAEPHGLAVWPQPGRYSLGHTGNIR